MIPQFEALARSSGIPEDQVKNQVAEMRLQVRELNTDISAAGKSFTDSFGSAATSALSNIANRTETLGESAKTFVKSIANSMLSWSANQLGQQAMAQVTQLINGVSATGAAAGQMASAGASAVGAGASAATAAAQSTAMTAAMATGSVSVATAIDTSFVMGSTTLVAAMDTSFATGAAILAQAITVASAASSGGSQAASAVGAVAAASFDVGGYTGHGGKYDPAGIVHRGEFVTRSEVTGQPGARDFLSLFNKYGMAVLPGYADGGLVAGPVVNVSSPSYKLATPSQTMGAGNVTLNQKVLPILDDDVIHQALQGPKGEEILLVHVTRNPRKFKNAMGIR
jgi:hypothetical protein